MEGGLAKPQRRSADILLIKIYQHKTIASKTLYCDLFLINYVGPAEFKVNTITYFTLAVGTIYNVCNFILNKKKDKK